MLKGGGFMSFPFCLHLSILYKTTFENKNNVNSNSVVISLSSCKKDYICKCEGEITFLIKNSSKSDAEAGCISANTSFTCNLK